MSTELQPVAATPAGARAPPPGAPQGGVYTETAYCGPVSWCISIVCAGNFACCCVPCCPCDRREAYVTQDKKKYSPTTGKEYVPTMGIYCCCE